MKKTLSLLLSLAVLLALLAGFATMANAVDGDIDIPIEDLFKPTDPSEPEDTDVLGSGTWENLTWTLSAQGVLQITGEGDMPQGQAPWYASRGRILTVEIGEGITSVGEQAFYNCSRMTDVVLPETLKKFETGAFVGCSRLTGIKIPASVEKIGVAAFGACTGLKEVELPEKLTVIEQRVFAQCESLNKIIIPEGMREIQAAAFAGCTSLSTVCYYGETAQWEQITIGSENYPLENARRYDNADESIRGDMNDDLEVNDTDAMYLLRHTLFASRYPLSQSGDENGDGAVNDADAMYLLRFTLFPSRYPLH